MGYQRKSFRVGWENEHFAAAILSKFCFISSPVKIGDDNGFDFMCTLFEEMGEDLIPKNSFMIQIKSSENGLNKKIKEKLEIIEKQQIPYMIGIIDKESKGLTIYSGENLYGFFAMGFMGSEKKISIALKNEKVKLPLKETEKKIIINFPKVLEIKISSNYKGISGLKEFEDVLRRSQRNVSRMKNHSFIFEQGDGKKIVYYGSTSAKYFLPNFIDVAIETIVNLERIDKTKVPKEDLDKLERLKEYLKKDWAKLE